MRARHITSDAEHVGDAHFEHAVEGGKGYAQLWFVGTSGTFHLEFSKANLELLAADATELAANL